MPKVNPVSAALEVVGTSSCFSSVSKGQREEADRDQLIPRGSQVSLQSPARWSSAVPHCIPEDCPQPSRETPQSLFHRRKPHWEVSTFTCSHPEELPPNNLQAPLLVQCS